MTKQSIFGRISQLVRANVNAMLDQAEDPEKMLEQMVRDFTNNIAEAEEAVAQTIGNLRMMEQDYQEDKETAQDWGQKALSASQRSDDFRNSGDTANAEKFDNLAKVALQRQMDSESSARNIESSLESQRQTVEQLKTGLNQMKVKQEQLVQKRDELVSRQRVAETQAQVHNAVKQIDVMDPTSELNRYEEQVRRVEAQTRGQQELAASSLENQFAELTDMGEQTEIEARLAALKTGGEPAALTSGSNKSTNVDDAINTDEVSSENN